MSSILDTVKKMLGLDTDYTAFDIDIIVLINTALMTLNQLGVGRSKTFHITGSSETWDDFLEARDDLEAVKTYIYLKTRAVFDPPSSSFVMDAMSKQCEELEWRLNARAETEGSDSDGVSDG